ncbi:probable E3 ubiquitin-protein ligase ATL45 [Aegilops tauschii subsp. strangulata]|uniref:probable E3 ubiquitin-protein ligase ATL45 n=1 Tax=Aegilops tauschii subsp. strangulata TaxID=200361 RepID=UPI00098B1417|nr:probable E3 ubiquitin-protein ligase ATL44 [Aegilops tauschii subsp. strangulata]
MPGSAVVLIGAFVAALLGVSLSTVVLCSSRRQAHRASPSPSPSQRSVVDLELGLGLGRQCGIDEAVLAAYPTAVYSSAARRLGEGQSLMAAAAALGEDGQAPGDTRDTTCAVCLTEYADGDDLRWLPGCRHAFHRPCLDEWLRRRPSCPLCRT